MNKRRIDIINTVPIGGEYVILFFTADIISVGH